MDFDTGHNSGQLHNGTGPYVFIAEIPEDQQPAMQLVLKVAGEDVFLGDRELNVVTPFEDTHYGTREMTVRDPDGRIWSRSISENAWNLYLIGVDRATTSPYAAPARATELAGLPPAYFGIGELDLMRDENIDYANRLMQAGVSAELHIFPGAFHGFELFAPESEIGKRALVEYGAALRRAFKLKA